MTIKLDRSTSDTVVIVCTRCPWWSAIRFGLEQAHTCATTHEKSEHPGVTQAREAARKWRLREAAPRR